MQNKASPLGEALFFLSYFMDFVVALELEFLVFEEHIFQTLAVSLYP